MVSGAQILAHLAQTGRARRVLGVGHSADVGLLKEETHAKEPRCDEVSDNSTAAHIETKAFAACATSSDNANKCEPISA